MVYVDKDRKGCLKQPILCPYMASESTMQSCSKIAHIGEIKTNRWPHSIDC